MAQKGKVQQGQQLIVQLLKHCFDSKMPPQVMSHPYFWVFWWVGLKDTADGEPLLPAEGGGVRAMLGGDSRGQQVPGKAGRRKGLCDKTSVV